MEEVEILAKKIQTIQHMENKSVIKQGEIKYWLIRLRCWYNWTTLARFFRNRKHGLKNVPILECEGGLKQQILYHKVKKDVLRRAEQKVLKIPGIYLFRDCHDVWAEQKRIFKEEYGLIWHSQADLYPGWDFD